MNFVSPSQVLKRVAEATPCECHEQILIIGSLAAGYHFLQKQLEVIAQRLLLEVVEALD